MGNFEDEVKIVSEPLITVNRYERGIVYPRPFPGLEDYDILKVIGPINDS